MNSGSLPAVMRSVPFLALGLSLSCSSAKPAIEIHPQAEVVLGEEVNIVLTGLQPSATYELAAELNDEYGRRWRSSATFVAGPSGEINTAYQAPVSGSYSEADPVGIFWSMELVEAPPELNIHDPADWSEVTFRLLHGGDVLATTLHKRWTVSPAVMVSTVAENGLVRMLFQPSGDESHPGLLLVGGSGGGMAWARHTAGVLASQGYSALALAYFNVESLPKQMERIPLEYFETALEFLAQHPRVDGDRLGVIGLSVGAELALVLGSRFHQIRAVVAYAPSSVVFQSFAPTQFPKTSAWTYRGEDLPFLPFLVDEEFRRTGDGNYLRYKSLGDAAALERAFIPVERIQGAILLLSGVDDAIWPSTLMAEQLMGRLYTARFAHTFRHLAFSDAGHGIARPGYLPTGDVSSRNGGTPRGTAQAQRRGFRRLLEFLSEELGE